MTPIQLLPTIEQAWTFASDWRISDDALFEIARVLIRYRPESILEIGPGISSWPLFRYCRLVFENEERDLKYHVIDERGSHYDKYCEWMVKQGYSVDAVWGLELTKEGYYDTAGLDFGKVDFLLIDGPAGNTRDTAAARKFVKQHVGPTTIIMIDDTNRASELSLAIWLNSDPDYSYKKTVIQDTMHRGRNSTLLIPTWRAENDAIAIRNPDPVNSQSQQYPGPAQTQSAVSFGVAYDSSGFPRFVDGQEQEDVTHG